MRRGCLCLDLCRSGESFREQAELMREEQRLLYVAVTRARHGIFSAVCNRSCSSTVCQPRIAGLVMSFTLTRGNSATAPSPFLRSLPTESCVPFAFLPPEASLAR